MDVVDVGGGRVEVLLPLAAALEAVRVVAEASRARPPRSAVVDDSLDAHSPGEGVLVPAPVGAEQPVLDQPYRLPPHVVIPRVHRPVDGAPLGVEAEVAGRKLLAAGHAPVRAVGVAGEPIRQRLRPLRNFLRAVVGRVVDVVLDRLVDQRAVIGRVVAEPTGEGGCRCHHEQRGDRGCDSDQAHPYEGPDRRAS